VDFPAAGGQHNPAADGNAGGGRRSDADEQDAASPLERAVLQLMWDHSCPQLKGLLTWHKPWAGVQEAKLAKGLEQQQQQVADQVRSCAATAHHDYPDFTGKPVLHGLSPLCLAGAERRNTSFVAAASLPVRGTVSLSFVSGINGMSRLLTRWPSAYNRIDIGAEEADEQARQAKQLRQMSDAVELLV